MELKGQREEGKGGEDTGGEGSEMKALFDILK